MGSSMMILSMLPAASAFAQTAPTVTLTEVGHNTVAAQVSVGSPVVFTASSTASNAEYQFWIESPNGTWTSAGGYSSNNSYTLTPSQSGDYLVTAYALSSSQLATGDYAAATNIGTDGNQQVDGVFVNSSVTLSTSKASVVAGHAFTVSATATNIYDAQYQFWYKNPSGTWKQSGNYSSSNSFTFTPSQSGTYTFIAYAKSPLAINDPEGALYSNVASGTVLPVVHIGLTDSASSLTNNGKSTDTFTAAVTDANGNPMSGVAVTFTSSASGVVSFASGTATTATTNASGIATATGTAGITVGTALVTAEADMQTSHAVTVTTVQGAATGISGVTVSPSIATVTASQSGSTAYNDTVTIGTAGTAETISAEIVDAQGNPVPNQMVVLQGNHVDQNASVSPFRQNSVQVPGSTTFTPFSASEFGQATTTASGMVSFTVENSANTTYNTMTATSSNTILFASGTSSYSLPFNTYTVDAVPASATASVKEGSALPSSVTSNAIGAAYIGWWPSQSPQMALAIEPQGTSLPATFQSQDSSTTVTVGTSGTFSVAPYFSDYASNQPNPDTTNGNQPVQFETGAFGFLEPGQSITYNLSTNGNGAIQSIFGVPLSGSGYGWSYDKATGLWYEATSGSPGTNYESANVTVTISIQEVSGFPAYTVSVTTPNATTPLPLTGGDLVLGATSSVPNPSMSSPLTPSLTFTTNDGVPQTNTVDVSATFDNLWEGAAGSASLVSGTQAINSASASVTYTAAHTPTTATFSPSYIQDATSINNQPFTDTITVDGVNGNPVPNAQVALDGAISGNTFSGYYKNSSNNNALWVTKVDGNGLAAGSMSDAFPLVQPNSGLLSNSDYVTPNAVPGLYSFNHSTLDVYTNSQGQINVTLQGGGAGFVANSTGSNAEYNSQPVTNNQYWLGVWNPANQTFLGKMNIGTGTPVTAPIPISTKYSTVKESATKIFAGGNFTVSGTVFQAGTGGSTPVSGATVNVSVDGVTGSTTTNSAGFYSVTVTPTAAATNAPVMVTANGTTISNSSDILTVNSDVSSAPTVTGSATATGFNLTWNSVSNAASYNVYKQNITTGTKPVLVENTTKTATSITGLTPGDTYEFFVTGVDQYGNAGPQSSPATNSDSHDVPSKGTYFEYGLLVKSVAGDSTAFSAATSSRPGTAYVYVTYDNNAHVPVTGDFTVTDTTTGTSLTVSAAAISTSKTGEVKLTLSIPAGDTSVGASDAFSVTGKTGTATNYYGQPAAGFTMGGTGL